MPGSIEVPPTIIPVHLTDPLGMPLQRLTAFAALAATALAHVLLPAGWIQIIMSIAVFTLLARDRQFGVLGAAILVLLSLPYDRAANNELMRIAGIPIRPHDAIVGIAIFMILPRVRFIRWSPTSAVIAGFLAVGAFALLVGLIAGNELRDIFRDARWWFMYVLGLLALAGGARRSPIFRGLLIGATVFAIVSIVTTLLPATEGGLKARSLVYDRGLLRMQFGNSVFLIPAACYAAWRWFGRPSLRSACWLILLVAAVTLSLTRTLVLVALASVALGAALWGIDRWRARRRATHRRATVRPVLGIAGLLILGLAGGIFVSTAEPIIGALTGMARGDTVEDVFDRLLFQGDRFGVGAIVSGRFNTYVEAMGRIESSPIVGLGLGSLVDAPYAYGGEEFDTPGKLPNVDDAYLTVGLKAGAIGIAAFAAMMLWPLLVWFHHRRNRLLLWMGPAWVGVLGLTITQSFSTTGYSPFTLALVVAALGGLGYASSRRRFAAAQV